MLYRKRSLQHHLALPRSAASVFGRLWASFEHLYEPFAPQYARRAVFSRSFRISDAVGTNHSTNGLEAAPIVQIAQKFEHFLETYRRPDGSR